MAEKLLDPFFARLAASFTLAGSCLTSCLSACAATHKTPPSIRNVRRVCVPILTGASTGLTGPAVNDDRRMSQTTASIPPALATAASEIPSTANAPLPVEWLRVSEAVTYSRMSKGALYALISEGRIKSFSNRQRGQIKGTRLISFDSLRAFLNSGATGGETKPAT